MLANREFPRFSRTAGQPPPYSARPLIDRIGKLSQPDAFFPRFSAKSRANCRRFQSFVDARVPVFRMCWIAGGRTDWPRPPFSAGCHLSQFELQTLPWLGLPGRRVNHTAPPLSALPPLI